MITISCKSWIPGPVSGDEALSWPWKGLDPASKKDLSRIVHRHRHPSIPTFASLLFRKLLELIFTVLLHNMTDAHTHARHYDTLGPVRAKNWMAIKR